MRFLEWIELTGIGIWVRESRSILAFPGILALHAVGMALMAGISTMIDLRVLGVAAQIPLSQLQRFLPVMWGGLLINAASGVLLVAAYPTKAFTNPIFYTKLACIAAAITIAQRLHKMVVRNSALNFGPVSTAGRAWAAASIALWTGAIVSGRFLAYTCRYLLAGVPC